MPSTLPMEMLQLLGNNQSCCQTFYLYLMNCTKHLPNIFYIRQCCGCFVIPFQQKHGVFDNCVFYSSLHLFNKWVSDSYDSITQSNTLTNKTHHSSQSNRPHKRISSRKIVWNNQTNWNIFNICCTPTVFLGKLMWVETGSPDYSMCRPRPRPPRSPPTQFATTSCLQKKPLIKT